MIRMNEDILRNQVVRLMCDLQGKLIYTQGELRDCISDGFGDCSSVVRWVYEKVIHKSIGSDTAEQIINLYGKDVDVGPEIHEENLLPGDLLFFTGGSELRPFLVGHVEMYIGPHYVVGQNAREEKGTFIKNIQEYMDYIHNIGLEYIKTRRFIG